MCTHSVHRARWFSAGIAGLCLALLSVSRAADKEKIVWKSIPDAILQVDSRAPKIWNVFQAGKKFDPLLLQLGSRYLVIYVRNMEVYEIKPEQLEHKGEDLLWRETDKPAKPIATSDWSTKDVGSAIAHSRETCRRRPRDQYPDSSSARSAARDLLIGERRGTSRPGRHPLRRS